MQLFAKRFWGFDPTLWPIISFHLPGNRDALVRASRPGDRIVFIGTETEDTDPPNRGRLLGMAEIGRQEVDSADVLDLATLKPSAFDEKGRLRWPKALPMVRAWRFVTPPLLKDVLQSQLSYEATVRAVLLGTADTKAVMALPNEEVRLRDVGAIASQRLLNDVLSAAGATTGPRPTSWSGTTGRDADRTSFSYAFRFGSRDVWKIGHATDVTGRLADVNRHVPYEVTGEQWTPVLQQSWPTEGDAYDMEQRVLAALRKPSSVGERVTCSKRMLETTWTGALLPKV